MLRIIVYVSIIFAVVALYIDGYVGAAHLGVGTEAATEHAEVRIVVVCISLNPFLRLQQFVWSHTFLYENSGKTSTSGSVAAFVFVCTNLTCPIASAEDVVRI